MLYRFGGGSFFLRRCLRRIGSLNSRGYEALAEERYDKALRYFRQSLEEGITYGARGGILRSLQGAGRYRAVLDSARVYSADTASYPLLPMLIERGDAHWALGDTASATALYDSVLSLGINHRLSTRAAARLYFLHHANKKLTGMNTYFLQPMSTPQRMAFLAEMIRSADDVRSRTILEMIYASLIAPELPATAISSLTTTLDSIPGLFVAHNDTIASSSVTEQFLVSSLISSLLDPWLYTETMNGSGLLPEVKEQALSLLNVAWRDDYPGIRVGSTAWYNERRTEVGRYIEYLHKHSILP